MKARRPASVVRRSGSAVGSSAWRLTSDRHASGRNDSSIVVFAVSGSDGTRRQQRSSALTRLGGSPGGSEEVRREIRVQRFLR
jgi:hypothetical protein